MWTEAVVSIAFCAHSVRWDESVQSRFGSSLNALRMQLEMRNIHSRSSIANLDAWNKLRFFRRQRTSQSYLPICQLGVPFCFSMASIGAFFSPSINCHA